MLLHSALCEGTLFHSREKPQPHRFQYQTKMVWLDLDETLQLDDLPFWSSSHWALVRFRRADYLQPHSKCLKQAVFDALLQRDIAPREGRVVLLTQLRSWGHSFNPVSFYFCFDTQQQLYAIVAEITNTPWAERFQYVLQSTPGHPHCFEFEKEFHVSPFMPMSLTYRWQFRLDGERVLINMRLLEQGEAVFHASLNLLKKPLTTTRAITASLGFPFQCLRVLRAIYWQAFRLWIKRTPVFDHPKTSLKKPIVNGDL